PWSSIPVAQTWFPTAATPASRLLPEPGLGALLTVQVEPCPRRTSESWFPVAGSRKVPTAQTSLPATVMPHRFVQIEPAAGRLTTLHEPPLNCSTSGWAPVTSSSDSPTAKTPAGPAATEEKAVVPAESAGV